MMLKHYSYFKDQEKSHRFLKRWVTQLERINQKVYRERKINTYLGSTMVYTLNEDADTTDTLVIFPGARTTSLFWDIDNALEVFGRSVRIYMVETNGLPNLSDGHTPDIKGSGYGQWAAQVLDRLALSKTYIAGASFGGLICMKLCLVEPTRVRAAFLLNPGCLQPFSLSLKNLYYNLLPIVLPRRSTIQSFLNKAIFHKPDHALNTEREELIIEYELHALTEYKDETQKPYFMGDELSKVQTDTYLLVGDYDLLFPFKKSIQNAKRLLPGLKETLIVPKTGHGIETSRTALRILADWMRQHTTGKNHEVNKKSIFVDSPEASETI